MSPARDFRGAGATRRVAGLGGAAGSGDVGADATSVGVSAVTTRGALGARAVAPRAGAATGCSGQTADANSSIVGERCSGSLESARGIAGERESGTSARPLRARGPDSKELL